MKSADDSELFDIFQTFRGTVPREGSALTKVLIQHHDLVERQAVGPLDFIKVETTDGSIVDARSGSVASRVAFVKFGVAIDPSKVSELAVAHARQLN